MSGPIGPTSQLRQLDASVGASGPHDFAVRLGAVRQRHRHVHRIPSRVRDDRETPLCRDGTAVDLKVIWVSGEEKYFFEGGWTRFAHNARNSPTGKSVQRVGFRSGWELSVTSGVLQDVTRLERIFHVSNPCEAMER